MGIFVRILYQDDNLVIVRKPPGMHVHPTELSRGEDTVLKLLRDQIGQWVYPAHRLDRPTSGVLLFTCSPEVAAIVGSDFQERRVRKLYTAIVRGWFPESVIADSALDDSDKVARPCQTRFHCLERYELPRPLGTFATVRASLVLCEALTGRRHQIRRHLARSGHPIIGDTGYGDRHHNHFYQANFNLSHLQLFSIGLGFWHPINRNWCSVMDATITEAGGLLNLLREHCSHIFSSLPDTILSPDRSESEARQGAFG